MSLDLCVTSSGLEADDTSWNPSPTLSEVDGQQPLIQEGFPIDTLKDSVCFSSFVCCASMCEAEVELAIYSCFPFSSSCLVIRILP